MARKGLKRVRFTIDGKTYERTGKTLAEAHKKAADLRVQIERGENVVSGSMTVKKWAYTWLDTYKSESVELGTYKSYKTYVDFIINEIGDMRLRDVKDIHIQRIMNLAAGRSKSYITKLRITVSSMFAHAASPGSRLIAYNPADFKHAVKSPLAEDNIRRSITDNERKYILKTMETHRAGLWLKIMLYAGLRPGECRALEWRHVDFKNRMIYVESAMKAQTKKIAGPKTKSGVRKIPMKNELYDALRACRGVPFAPVLPREGTDQRHNASTMNDMWLNFKRHVDLSMGAKVYRNQIILSLVAADLVPTCLRHTYCTDLQAAGVPLKVASYLMGHRDIRTTANIYTDVTDEMLLDAAMKINGAKSVTDEPTAEMLADVANRVNAGN